MKDGPDIARIAALIGDPARANMLTALMSGMALTATELAAEAGVTVQTASGHLARLTDGGLLVRQKQGRHRYFALASADVAGVIEALMGLAQGAGQVRSRIGPRDAALRHARICYNHLAGELGVQLYDSLIQRGFLVTQGETVHLQPEGRALMLSLGLEMERLEAGRSPLCRCCLDWSGRRMHLGGSLGRALMSHFLHDGWMARDPGGRSLAVSRNGERLFAQHFPAQPVGSQIEQVKVMQNSGVSGAVLR